MIADISPSTDLHSLDIGMEEKHLHVPKVYFSRGQPWDGICWDTCKHMDCTFTVGLRGWSSANKRISHPTKHPPVLKQEPVKLSQGS